MRGFALHRGRTRWGGGRDGRSRHGRVRGLTVGAGRRKPRQSRAPDPGRKPSACLQYTEGGGRAVPRRGYSTARTSTAVMLSVPPRSSEVATSRSPNSSRLPGPASRICSAASSRPPYSPSLHSNSCSPGDEWAFADFHFGVFPRAQHVGEHVPHRVMGELGAVELRVACQDGGDPRVVVRDLLKCASSEDVDPAVADAAERERAAVDQRDDDRRAHAGQVGLVFAGLVHLAVGQAHRGDQPVGVHRQGRDRSQTATSGRDRLCWPPESSGPSRPPSSRRLRLPDGRPCHRRPRTVPPGTSHSNASSLFGRTRPGCVTPYAVNFKARPY